MKMKLFKNALPWLALAVLLPVLALSLNVVPAEAGCCGGTPPETELFRLYVSPDGGGDVSIGGELPGPYPYVHLIEKGTLLSLEATPADGYYFVGWSGALSGDQNPIAIAVTTETNITAHFFPEEIVSEDNRLTIDFREGTVVQDEYGERLFDIELAIAATTPPPPPEGEIVGPTYELGPHGATFDREATLTFNYDPAEIPSGVAEGDLVLGYYDEEADEWLLLRTRGDTEKDILSTHFDHLSTFAVIAPDPQSPAAFTISALNISPLETDSGQTVTVSVLVTNAGELEGSYSLSLVVNGTVVETRQITMASGSQTEIFNTTADEAGSYSVEINGLEGSFTVREAAVVSEEEGLSGTVLWTIVGLSIAALLVLVIVIIVKVRRRRDDFYYYWY
ncbi:MAG: hypothetical protein PVJ08_02995 [Dehalococcoidia bacterium]